MRKTTNVKSLKLLVYLNNHTNVKLTLGYDLKRLSLFLDDFLTFINIT